MFYYVFYFSGKPKSLPQLESIPDNLKENVTLFRKIEDFKKLDKISENIKSITIIGGGFLGSELACALGHRSKASDMEVVQVFHEAGNMGKVLPDYLSEWTTDKVRSEGVTVIPQTRVKSVTAGDKTKLSVALDTGKKLATDHMVVAVSVFKKCQYL